MGRYSKFYFRPAKGEQVTTTIMPEGDEYSAIFGRVVDKQEKPVTDALVLLFHMNDTQTPELIGRFRTDNDGHFMFGPLEGGILYSIKVYKNSLKVRELEIKMD